VENMQVRGGVDEIQNYIKGDKVVKEKERQK
jgi:hypothetical protein